MLEGNKSASVVATRTLDILTSEIQSKINGSEDNTNFRVAYIYTNRLLYSSKITLENLTSSLDLVDIHSGEIVSPKRKELLLRSVNISNLEMLRSEALSRPTSKSSELDVFCTHESKREGNLPVALASLGVFLTMLGSIIFILVKSFF